jgi:aryl-alcohol dehydrogenase-like predicted oxidoreductase
MPDGWLSPRPLGASGIDVSALSLGSWRTYDRLPAEAGVAVMRAAWDEGIRFFDDARYDDETGRAPIPTGYSEVLFGELFRSAGLRRDEAVVANKLWWEFWPEQSAEAELDASLRRMGFQYIDLIYTSAPPDPMPVADLVADVTALITTGKARAWGLLNWPADLVTQAARAAASLGAPPPCAAQLPYSLVHRQPVEDPVMTEALRASGAGVVASFCLAGGVLTGKYQPAANPPAGHQPSGSGRQAGRAQGPPGEVTAGRAASTLGEPRVAAAQAAAAELAELAVDLRTTATALALAFALARPDVSSALFGATSAEQVLANCAAVALADRLTQADLARLRLIGRSADGDR